MQENWTENKASEKKNFNPESLHPTQELSQLFPVQHMHPLVQQKQADPIPQDQIKNQVMIHSHEHFQTRDQQDWMRLAMVHSVSNTLPRNDSNISDSGGSHSDIPQSFNQNTPSTGGTMLRSDSSLSVLSSSPLLPVQASRSHGGTDINGLSLATPGTWEGSSNRGSEISSCAPFTVGQWQELEQQALIFKYLVAGAPVPAELVSSLRLPLSAAAFTQRQNGLWGRSPAIDLEPKRCRRTDGKKWRCAREVLPDQKYCEKHMHRGRHRSKKVAENANSNANTNAKANANINANASANANTNSNSAVNDNMVQISNTSVDSISLTHSIDRPTSNFNQSNPLLLSALQETPSSSLPKQTSVRRERKRQASLNSSALKEISKEDMIAEAKAVMDVQVQTKSVQMGSKSVSNLNTGLSEPLLIAQIPSKSIPNLSHVESQNVPNLSSGLTLVQEPEAMNQTLKTVSEPNSMPNAHVNTNINVNIGMNSHFSDANIRPTQAYEFVDMLDQRRGISESQSFAQIQSQSQNQSQAFNDALKNLVSQNYASEMANLTQTYLLDNSNPSSPSPSQWPSLHPFPSQDMKDCSLNPIELHKVSVESSQVLLQHPSTNASTSTSVFSSPRIEKSSLSIKIPVAQPSLFSQAVLNGTYNTSLTLQSTPQPLHMFLEDWPGTVRTQTNQWENRNEGKLVRMPSIDLTPKLSPLKLGLNSGIEEEKKEVGKDNTVETPMLQLNSTCPPWNPGQQQQLSKQEQQQTEQLQQFQLLQNHHQLLIQQEQLHRIKQQAQPQENQMQQLQNQESSFDQKKEKQQPQEAEQNAHQLQNEQKLMEQNQLQENQQEQQKQEKEEQEMEQEKQHPNDCQLKQDRDQEQDDQQNIWDESMVTPLSEALPSVIMSSDTKTESFLNSTGMLNPGDSAQISS